MGSLECHADAVATTDTYPSMVPRAGVGSVGLRGVF
jgi:hypothetical protein